MSASETFKNRKSFSVGVCLFEEDSAIVFAHIGTLGAVGAVC